MLNIFYCEKKKSKSEYLNQGFYLLYYFDYIQFDTFIFFLNPT